MRTPNRLTLDLEPPSPPRHHDSRTILPAFALTLLLLAAQGTGCARAVFPEGVDCTEVVCLTFFVDDRINRVFNDEAELEWKGSFRLEEPDSEVILYDSNWPGPFPRLYDDGPLPEGHEMPGAEAEDKIWSTLVKILPPEEEPIVLQYGAQWGHSNWIWSCKNASEPCEDGMTNGTLRITSADVGQTLAAAGLILPKHGSLDLKLILDTHDLAGTPAEDCPTKCQTEEECTAEEDCIEGRCLPGEVTCAQDTDCPEDSTCTQTHCFPKRCKDYFPDRSVVKVKTSYNGWDLKPCNDEGKWEDAEAGDGKWTCLLSRMLNEYSGLLDCSTSVAFVFTLGQANAEYKVDGRPPKQGVQAYLGAAGLPWPENEARIDWDDSEYSNTFVSTLACPE